MNEQVYVMTKSYKYNMFGAYKRIDNGTYYHYVFLPYHSKNAGSVKRSNTDVPKTDASHVDYYFISPE